MDTTSTPPTSALPPIARISSFDPIALSSALQYLRVLYLPSVRGSRRRRPTLEPSEASSYSDDPSNDGTRSSNEVLSLESLRSDAFERSYSMRWLTALISNLEDKLNNNTGDNGFSESLKAGYNHLINDAASLLAASAGTASAGTLTRTFTFTSAPHGRSSSTSSLSFEVTVQLTDLPLENADYASVGAQTWGGACVLSEDIVQRPQDFGLACQMARPLRILELGAGTGLVSILIGKLLSQMGSDAIIVASDFHPSVLANLAANISANFQNTVGSRESSPDGVQRIAHRGPISVSSALLDWSKLASLPADTKAEQPFAEPFDLIFGADIIYEEKHAEWIKACLERLLRKPLHATYGGSRGTTVEHNFHLVIPLRPTHTSESSTVQSVFERRETVETRRVSEGDGQAMDPVLCIHRSDTIVCDAEPTSNGKEGEEVLYAYYQIGWF